MLKLMKYELRKTRMFFLVTVAIIAITELLFLIGYYGNFETPFVISMTLAFLIFIGGFFAAMVFSFMLYYNDISKKPGYLLFMTPQSTAKIIASKLLVGFIGLIGILLLEGIFAVPSFLLVFHDQSDGASLVDMIIRPVMDAMKGNWGYIILWLITLVISWFADIVGIFAAIALSRTLLGNQKGGNLVAFLFWIGINTVESIITYLGTFLFGDFLSPSMGINTEAMSASEAVSVVVNFTATPLVFSLVLTIVFGVGLYALTVWLTDKKMSL